MNRRLLLVVPALALLVGTSACGADWFGNGTTPHPRPTPTPDVCAAKTAAAPPDAALDPMRRPPEVLPGWSWMVISPQVRALKAGDTKTDYCVPFGVHLYGTMTGVPEIAIVLGGGRQIALPYDAQLTTPWSGSRLLLEYDPRSERWRNTPPVYSFTLIASYAAERDVLYVGQDIAAFRCAFQANGATVSQQLVTKSPYTTQCTLKASAFNPY